MSTDPSMQSVETSRPAVHLINRDVPTHAQLNENPTNRHSKCGCSIGRLTGCLQ